MFNDWHNDCDIKYRTVTVCGQIFKHVYMCIQNYIYEKGGGVSDGVNRACKQRNKCLMHGFTCV